MDANRLNAWLSLVATAGVLLGLVFLIYELRQNSELMRIQIQQARADAAMLSNEQMFNSDYLPTILLKIGDGEELSEEERMRYVFWFRASNRNQDNVLSQYRAGMLGDNVPLSVDDFVRDAIASSTSARNAWDQTKIGYTKAYVTFVEEILDE